MKSIQWLISFADLKSFFPSTNSASDWLQQYDWLEYSVAKDATFFFYCFLFKQNPLETHFGHDAFSKEGYSNWIII